SPSGYTFLREQNLLPLPCVDTLRRHLMAVNIGCDFDEKFFKILEKKFMNKTLYEKKKDLGDDFDNKVELANHALVLMIQSLSENFIHLKKASMKWKIYETVFEHDSKSYLKVYPKLTKSHFQLNNFSKMKTFSKSMADGIVFFKSKNYSGFDKNEETVEFTLLFYNVFDALNRKFSAKGIKKK
ncbi:hypothetical protein AGLY_016907, partial [Aphis glycines]